MKKICLFAAVSALMVTVSCNEKKNYSGSLTEALDSSLWEQSEWISAANAAVVTGKVEINENNRAADGASWFMATVSNRGKVVKAEWMTTGLGVYELYVNGRKIGREVLKPGFTHFAKTKRSFTYDVTEAFNCKAGAENVLAAQLTPGWWADKVMTHGDGDGMEGKKCAFRAVLLLSYADGSTRVFGTDLENWKAGIAGPVTHAAIFDGEEYDARILPGYETPEKLMTPEPNSEFNGEIIPTCGAEVYHREDLALAPIRAYCWKGVNGETEEAYGTVNIVKEFHSGEEMTVNPGETLVVDFGQNCAAVPQFEFCAEEGTVLTCLTSEIMNDGNGAKERGMDGPEGSVHRLNLRIPDDGMRVIYTFAGRKEGESYRPSCTFFGYRLVSITASSEVRIKSILSIPVTSIAKELETGSITTGNELINKLISNTMWGQRSNYLSIPTDCPQRNERLGWTADTQVFTETGTFFANTDPFFHKWMRDMRDTQSELGGFPGVAPWGQYGSVNTSMTRVGWADAGIIVPWTIWKQFGDRAIVEESWDSMEKFMNHIYETKYDHETLKAENSNYQWADWLSYEPLESCGGTAFDNGRVKPEALEYWNFLCASYWMSDAAMMRDMAADCGRDAARFEQMRVEAGEYIRSKFFTPDGDFKLDILNTMQTPALFALRNGIVSGEARERMINRLRKNFEDHDGCLQTGFLGTSILMGTLTENGMEDIAWNLLFQRKNPSWLYSVDNGATTIWERWNSYTIEKGMGPKGMNSFNHYAYGCVCEWLWETAAGIAADPASPGFKHIIMKPVPDKRLGSLSARYKSAAGEICSSWVYDGDSCVWSFTIPEGATASVTLPGSDESTEYSAGKYVVVL